MWVVIADEDNDITIVGWGTTRALAEELLAETRPKKPPHLIYERGSLFESEQVRAWLMTRGHADPEGMSLWLFRTLDRHIPKRLLPSYSSGAG